MLTPLSDCRKAEGKAAATSELPPEYLTSPLSQQSQVSGCPLGDLVMLACSFIPLVTAASSFCLQLPPKRDETALQEEEELQLAIALSQSEAEEKERMVCTLLGIWACFFATQLVAGWLIQRSLDGPRVDFFSLLQRQKTSYSMYPKAEPTPVTSSAPPAGTLYSPPVVRSWAAEHKVAGHRPVPQPSSALFGSDWIPVLRKTLPPSVFFVQKVCAQLAHRCLCCWHEARVAACSSAVCAWWKEVAAPLSVLVLSAGGCARARSGQDSCVGASVFLFLLMGFPLFLHRIPLLPWLRTLTLR